MLFLMHSDHKYLRISPIQNFKLQDNLIIKILFAFRYIHKSSWCKIASSSTGQMRVEMMSVLIFICRKRNSFRKWSSLVLGHSQHY
jgi:hypothetical protein